MIIDELMVLSILTKITESCIDIDAVTNSGYVVPIKFVHGHMCYYLIEMLSVFMFLWIWYAPMQSHNFKWKTLWHSLSFEWPKGKLYEWISWISKLLWLSLTTSITREVYDECHYYRNSKMLHQPVTYFFSI